MAKEAKEITAKVNTVVCTVDEELHGAIKTIMEDTGATKAEVTRRALKKFINDGQDEALVMMNVVQIIQTLNSLEEIIPEKDYKKLESYTANIMKIKGGK